MDSTIEWSPVRSIAAAAAEDQQQLASQAANELRMRSLQVRHKCCARVWCIHPVAKQSHLLPHLTGPMLLAARKDTPGQLAVYPPSYVPSAYKSGLEA